MDNAPRNRFKIMLAIFTFALVVLFCAEPPPEEMTLKPGELAANEQSTGEIPSLKYLYEESEPVEGEHFLIVPIPVDLSVPEIYGEALYFHTFNVKADDKIVLDGCADSEEVLTRQAPDFRFTIEDEDVGEVRVFFIPDDQSRETYLILYQSGNTTERFACYDGRNVLDVDSYPEGFKPPPMFTVKEPSVEYSVWIGSKSQNDDDNPEFAIHGTLYVSSADALDPEKLRLNFIAGNETIVIDIDEEFKAFEPEPIMVDVRGTNEEPLLGNVNPSALVTALIVASAPVLEAVCLLSASVAIVYNLA